MYIEAMEFRQGLLISFPPIFLNCHPTLKKPMRSVCFSLESNPASFVVQNNWCVHCVSVLDPDPAQFFTYDSNNLLVKQKKKQQNYHNQPLKLDLKKSFFTKVNLKKR